MPSYHPLVSMLAGRSNVSFFRYGKAAATAYVQGILTSEPHEISLLFFLWYLHSGGGKPGFSLSDIIVAFNPICKLVVIN